MLKSSRSYEVLRVFEKDPKFLEFMEGLQLRPGTHLRVHQREYDETMAVSIAHRAAAFTLANPPPNASGSAASRLRRSFKSRYPMLR